MSHISLYRKYRPQSFDQVLGQLETITSLQNIVRSGTPSHAYLFVGGRGTGKTSTARIFARELGVDSMDIHEIDAASYRGVEKMRELVMDVMTLPVLSPYKVYILDEVHMLTKDSFNTFLKTLEEPPAHVIFILATTELDKVLDTIISRCQVYHFKQPNRDTVSAMLIAGATAEGYTLDTDAAELISHGAQGAFRDAWGILERVITHTDTGAHITVAHVESTMGSAGSRAVLILDACHDRDLSKILGLLTEFRSSGGDSVVILDQIIHYVRCIMLVRFAPIVATDIMSGMDPDISGKIHTYAAEKNIFSAAMLSRLLSARDTADRSGLPYIPVELAFIEIFDSIENS